MILYKTKINHQCSFLTILVIFLNMLNIAEGNSEEILQNEFWTLRFDPGSLQVFATPAGKEGVYISLPQQDLGSIESLNSFDFIDSGRKGVSWNIPQKGLFVSLLLDGKWIEVKFRSQIPGLFTWPILSTNEPTRACILPLSEGSYIPSRDAEWIDFLVSRSPINTTEGLSMPFWGLDVGDYTLTYILTNPFNNELAFQNHSNCLGMSLTHEFTKNWDVKEYGLVICSGEASPIEPAKKYRQWLINRGEFVSMKEKIQHIPEVEKLLGASHIYLWGNGVSVKMMEQFSEMGFQHLWLGLNSWNDGLKNPQAIAKAKELGYLIGPYDSYHSIHHPNEPDTWETAQFDLELYEKGPIIKANGDKIPGFNKKGYKLSPIMAKPYVEKRVKGIMDRVQFNSWFIDCDAFGELYDDYSELHPATQWDDMRARMERIAWIRDTYKVVVGSEGGAAYSASTIHFGHGIMTPVIGWGDPDLKNRGNKYYLGAYWPLEGPATFIKQVPLKPYYFRFFFDPAFRLPLYQTVFHDSVVTTHHWNYASLKFIDQMDTLELLELLYNVPPLYHINQEEFKKHGKRIKAHYDFFSPLHKETALLPLIDFRWLTSDHLVQKTRFGDKIIMVANFGTENFIYEDRLIPGGSIMAKWIDSGTEKVFSPR